MKTTEPEPGGAPTLAPWVHEMQLADKVFITGATVALARIRTRRSDLPAQIDEAKLREGSPSDAYRAATALMRAYAGQPPYAGPDGRDEHQRIARLAHDIAARIAKYHPGLL